MTSYRLETIRLVNFHNFVDEVIEIRDGGHLFLLGDNGSGKTTVLDAVHYVLAGGDLELNAAARLGGKRDEGRTLQGIVLRHDFERGVRNQGGAIAYAAIELCDRASGRRMSLGVGTEATTMEARVGRWGFVTTRPLAEIALVDDASVPLDRDALRSQLGATSVFAQLTAYRKELARRLFGSERQYEDAVRFWGMAKAYREIVAGARDFGALFMRLLPTPDTGVFDEIVRTLRAVDDLEVALRDLDAQAGYVRGLVELVSEVATGRETCARYHWLVCQRDCDESAVAAERARGDAEGHREDAARIGADAEAARLRSERLAESLRRTEADDAAGALGAVREAEVRHAELTVEVERAQHAGAAATRDHDAARRGQALHRGTLRELAQRVAAELRAVAAEVSEVPGDLAAVHQVGNALDQVVGRSDVRLPETGEAEREVAWLAHRAADAMVTARAGEIAARTARDDAARALGDLEAVTETGPAVPGHAAACRALANAGIAARSLYELLEPVTGATASSLAAIEALAGHDVLGALVVDGDHRAHARQLVAGVAPAVRIVITGEDPRPAGGAVEGPTPRDGALRIAGSTRGVAQLPAWCAGVLASDDEDALGALAAALAQPPAFGELAAPRPGGDVELRGLGFRVHAAAPVLLGVEARRRAHADRVASARADLAEHDRTLEQAVRRVAAAEAAGAGVERLERALRAAAGAAINAAWHAAAAADHRVELAARVIAEADARAIEAGNRLAAVEVDLAALRARVAGVDLDELERRLAALRVASGAARTAWADLLGRKATAEAAAALADGRARAAIERIGSLEPQLVEAERELRSCLAAIGSALAQVTTVELTHYVRVTQRGDTFRSVETLRQRIADVRRTTEAASDELERDGSRGVRCLAYASRFGLVYDRTRNHIEDRRSQPIAGVLAELERSILDQRSVINERTRELMDTLVMGELARHLQGQIHHLYETIKGINRVLGGLRFGPSEYQFQVTPRADRTELVELVRRLSILDEDSRRQFRAWIDARLDELRAGDDAAVPALLDYRQWFDYKLRMSTTDAAGVELTHRLRQVGSGGEQGVPNYLLVLALGKLMFDAADASVRPMLFDEAFYGIDGGRRDQLLRLATDLGLQLFVASPDQDGVTPAVRAATTLFVVKDANHDVHLAPYHYWNRGRDDQPGLFDTPAPSDDLAECRTAPTASSSP